MLVPSYGGLFRLANCDADAIGLQTTPVETMVSSGQALSGEALEKEVWQALKYGASILEIPVNIVDLGLIYGMEVSQLPLTELALM